MEKQNFEKQIQELRTELETIKQKEKNKALRLKRMLKTSFVFGALATSLYAFAAVISSLHIFQDGQIISAQKINENFAYLENRINNVASGNGGIKQTINTFTDLTATTIHDGATYTVHDSLLLRLPDINTLEIGYSIKLIQTPGSQVEFLPAQNYSVTESAMSYNPANDVILKVFDAMSPTELIRIYKVFNNGSAWEIHNISGMSSSLNTFMRTSLSAEACTGKGVGATNCYTNSTAQAAGHVKVNGFYYYWNAIEWSQLGSGSTYLINDPNNDLPGLERGSYELRDATLLQNSTNYIFATLSMTSSISGMLGWMFDHTYHTMPNQANRVNNIVKQYYKNNGENCYNRLGENFRLLTEAEMLAEASSLPDGDYWTASTGSTNDSYISISIAAGVPTATETDISMTDPNRTILCIFDPVP